MEKNDDDMLQGHRSQASFKGTYWPSPGNFSTKINNDSQGLCVHLQSCPTLCDSMDCSLPVSSVHGISQARILE